MGDIKTATEPECDKYASSELRLGKIFQERLNMFGSNTSMNIEKWLVTQKM